MALSSYFATHKTLVANTANSSLPIAIFHGIYDGVVSETLASQALQVLRGKGYSPVYKSYLMEHEVCMEEVADISQWLQQRLTDKHNLAINAVTAVSTRKIRSPNSTGINPC